MGNQQSAPEGFTQEESMGRLYTNANQSRLIGNPDPVVQTQAAREVLAAASPNGLNLSHATNADTSAIEAKDQYCAQFTQLDGLRRLQSKVGTRTALEPGCGWVYGNGQSFGAFGGVKQMPDGSTNEVPFRAVTNGAQFYMDLEKAERLITNDLRNKYQTCESLSKAATDPSEVNSVGFCKETGKVIPIERSPGVAARPRFPDHPDFRCSGEIVVPELANKQTCATAVTGRQGFRNPTSVDKAGSAYIAGGGSAANYHSVFNTPQWAIQNERAVAVRPIGNSVRGVVENFADTVSCAGRGNLRASDVDCLIAAATEADFQNTGSYLPYLTSKIEPDALSNYNRLTKTDISIAGLLNGTRTFMDLISVLRQVKLNLSSTDERIKAAAMDLYNAADTYKNNFNLCEWFDDPKENETRLRSTMENAAGYQKCMENYWRNNGGDSRGTAFPRLANYEGKSVQEFKNDVAYNNRMISQKDPNQQSSALGRKIGVATYLEQTSGNVVAPPQECKYELVDIPGEKQCPAFYPMNEPRPKINKKVVITQAALANGTCKYNGGEIVSVDCESSQPLIPQNCVWTSQISECGPKTCGKGTQTKTWTKTVFENVLGTCPPQPKDEIIQCVATDCGQGDCKYVIKETQTCPSGPNVPCGQQFKKITQYVLDPDNIAEAQKFCPTPNPKIEDCPVVQCPPPIPPAPPTTNNTKLLTLTISAWDGGVFANGRGYYDAGAPSYFLRLFLPPRDSTGKDISWWTGPLALYAAIGRNPTVTLYRAKDGSRRTITGWSRESKIVKLPGFLAGSFYWFQGIDSTSGVKYNPGDVITLQYEDSGLPQVNPCEAQLFYNETYGAGFFPYIGGNPGMLPTYTVVTTGDYDGSSFLSQPDVTNIDASKLVTNKKPISGAIRSIRVGAGVSLTAYSNRGFTGNSVTITQDNPILPFAVNSFKVVANGQVPACLPPPPPPPPPIGDCEAEFFFQQNFQGNSVRLSLGNYDMGTMRERGIPNDSIRSMRLGKRVNVVAHYHAGLSWPFYIFTSDQAFLGNYDKHISGLKIITKDGRPCTPPRTLLGTFIAVGLNPGNGKLSYRNGWLVDLDIGYIDANNKNIESTLTTLNDDFKLGKKISIDFARVLPNNTEVVEFQMKFGGTYNDYTGGIHPRFNRVMENMITRKTYEPQYTSAYNIYYTYS